MRRMIWCESVNQYLSFGDKLLFYGDVSFIGQAKQVWLEELGSKNHKNFV